MRFDKNIKMNMTEQSKADKFPVADGQQKECRGQGYTAWQGTYVESLICRT
jgi:hypothetical protein